jgi:hypothetical protein
VLLFSVKNNEKGSAEFKKRFRKLGFTGENIVIGKGLSVRNCTKISLKLHKQKISNCKQAGFCELKNCIKPSFKLH